MNPKAAGSKAVPTPKSSVPIDGSLLYALRQLDTMAPWGSIERNLCPTAYPVHGDTHDPS